MQSHYHAAREVWTGYNVKQNFEEISSCPNSSRIVIKQPQPQILLSLAYVMLYICNDNGFSQRSQGFEKLQQFQQWKRFHFSSCFGREMFFDFWKIAVYHRDFFRTCLNLFHLNDTITPKP